MPSIVRDWNLTTGRAGFPGAVALAATLWALLGGLVLLAVVAMNVASVIGGIVWVPFPGDFEMTQIGVAVAAFSFLPYTQITGGNVTADIFTSGAGVRTRAALTCLASLVAFGFALVLLWRMYAGMLDQKAYSYTTTILQFPIWLAFLPILISLALLALAAFVSFTEDMRRAVTPPKVREN
ncbi:hypothetical protein GCM10011316_35040 [Roseibium aquae]|uniref:TRAP transporter small permease protein n=1 Tax=Roseibium aquae TaxID=1323746 RepID=A0A916TQ06_9HYPH|nr:TRAP transporter small permease [Roseibium aquae]GGB60011.1 hypothetical protein GCM10011316_35040 [Roseibium aquae]